MARQPFEATPARYLVRSLDDSNYTLVSEAGLHYYVGPTNEVLRITEVEPVTVTLEITNADK